MSASLPSSGNLNNLMSQFNNSSGSTVYNFLSKETETSWGTMSSSITNWLNLNKPSISGLRVLISLSDGTVAYDSNSSFNSFVDYKAKKINENHNSRIPIFTALISNSGVALEQRYSSSTGRFTNYIAQRVGLSAQDSMGCVRISVDQPNVL